MNDLISRQAAIDAAVEAADEWDGGYSRSREEIITLKLRMLPSAQQDCEDCPEYDHDRHYCQKYCDVIQRTLEEAKQERTGRWIPDNNNMYEMRFICSECKESQVVPTIGFTKYKPLWDYCPYCGARLEGEG